MERQISVNCVIAYGLWAATFAVWTVSWVVDIEALMALSVLVGMIAATATIRTYFITQNARIKTAMVVTGREPVTPLRR